jgi:hypothetical protein
MQNSLLLLLLLALLVAVLLLLLTWIPCSPGVVQKLSA